MSEFELAFAAGETFVEVGGIEVTLIATRSKARAAIIDRRVVDKDASEYHGREAMAKAYEDRGDWHLAAMEWEDCARERVEAAVLVAMCIDRGHFGGDFVLRASGQGSVV